MQLQIVDDIRSLKLRLMIKETELKIHQELCKHEFESTEAHIVTEGYWRYDAWAGNVWEPETTKHRWLNTCKICDFKVYTSRKDSIKN